MDAEAREDRRKIVRLEQELERTMLAISPHRYEPHEMRASLESRRASRLGEDAVRKELLGYSLEERASAWRASGRGHEAVRKALFEVSAQQLPEPRKLVSDVSAIAAPDGQKVDPETSLVARPAAAEAEIIDQGRS
jgi:hypothetical protein